MVYGSAEAKPAARGVRFWLSVTGGKYFHRLALLGLGNFIVDNVPTWFAGGAEGSPDGIVAGGYSRQVRLPTEAIAIDSQVAQPDNTGWTCKCGAPVAIRYENGWAVHTRTGWVPP